MNDAAINDIANYVVIAVTIPAVLNAAIYGLGSRWWSSWLGRVLFSKWLSVALVFVFILTRRLWGDYPGYGWWAIGLYTFVLVSFAATTVELIIERRAPAELIETPIRKAVIMTNTTEGVDAPVIWYKGKRVLRTIVQALVVLVPLVNLLAVAIIGYLNEQTNLDIAPVVFVWLNAIVALTAFVMGLVARIMAVPGVNDLLVKIGLGSVPAKAIQAPGVVAPDRKLL